MKTSTNKSDWLNACFNDYYNTNIIPKSLEIKIKSYLFSSYRLNREINGSVFNELYDKNKVTISKVINTNLGTCRNNNLLNTVYKKRFETTPDHKKVLYIEMEVEVSNDDKYFTLIRKYRFIITKKKFVKFC